MAVLGPRGPGYLHKQYRPYDIQDLQYWQDKTSEAVMVLEANEGVLSSIRRFYVSLEALRDFPQKLKDECNDDVLSFTTHLDDIIYDFKMQISRAKLLIGIISDRKELVSRKIKG